MYKNKGLTFYAPDITARPVIEHERIIHEKNSIGYLEARIKYETKENKDQNLDRVMFYSIGGKPLIDFADSTGGTPLPEFYDSYPYFISEAQYSDFDDSTPYREREFYERIYEIYDPDEDGDTFSFIPSYGKRTFSFKADVVKIIAYRVDTDGMKRKAKYDEDLEFEYGKDFELIKKYGRIIFSEDAYDRLKSENADKWTGEYILEIYVEKYRKITDNRTLTEDDVSRIAVMQALQASILEYTYQFQVAQDVTQRISAMAYTALVTIVSTAILIAGQAVKIAMKAVKEVGEEAGKVALTDLIVACIKETGQEIITDPIIEAFIQTGLQRLGCPDLAVTILSTYAESGRETALGGVSEGISKMKQKSNTKTKTETQAKETISQNPEQEIQLSQEAEQKMEDSIKEAKEGSFVKKAGLFALRAFGLIMTFSTGISAFGFFGPSLSCAVSVVSTYIATGMDGTKKALGAAVKSKKAVKMMDSKLTQERKAQIMQDQNYNGKMFEKVMKQAIKEKTHALSELQRKKAEASKTLATLLATLFKNKAEVSEGWKATLEKEKVNNPDQNRQSESQQIVEETVKSTLSQKVNNLASKISGLRNRRLMAFMVMSGSMSGMYEIGDIAGAKKVTRFTRYNKGDVIVFVNKDGVRVIHQIVDTIMVNGETQYRTKGLVNQEMDSDPVSKSDIIGKASVTKSELARIIQRVEQGKTTLMEAFGLENNQDTGPRYSEITLQNTRRLGDRIKIKVGGDTKVEIIVVSQQDQNGNLYCDEASFIQILHNLLRTGDSNKQGEKWIKKLYKKVKNYYPSYSAFKNGIKNDPNQILGEILERGQSKLIRDVRNKVLGIKEFGTNLNQLKGKKNWLIPYGWIAARDGRAIDAVDSKRISSRDDIIATLIEHLDQGEQVYALLNGYRTPGKYDPHWVVIIGYDLENNAFIISDSDAPNDRGVQGHFMRVNEDIIQQSFQIGRFIQLL